MMVKIKRKHSVHGSIQIEDIQEKIIGRETSYDGREMTFDSTVNYAKGSTRTIQVTINGDSVKTTAVIWQAHH